MDINDRELLALTLQAEAGNQGLDGMMAAGSVIMNRANASGYGNGLRGVILKPGQFSAWNSSTGYAGGEQGQDMTKMRASDDAYKAADALIAGGYEDVTGGATHFYNPDISQPNWGQKAGGDWKRIGDHVFGFADSNGGLLTSSGGANIMPMDPTKKPYMMGGDQTYSSNPQAAQQAAQQAQPQQGGLGGLLSTLKDKATAVDPRTGLTGFEQFASALDPLIMKQFRGGESIREAGAGRVAAGNKNRTVEMLKARGRKDLAEMVERGMISPTEAAGQLLAVPKEKGRTVDAAALRKMFPGAQIEDGLYNLKPDGTATKVGGGGVNVSVGGEGTEAFEKEFGQLDARKLAAIDNVGSSASRSLTQINRLETLLGNVPTGMSANIKQLAGNFGIQSEDLDDIQAATAIINALVPAQRPAGSGPMSDADLDLFKQSLPRIINSPGGNQMIIDTMRGLAQYDAMGSEIVQRFRAKEISKVDAFKLLNSRPDPFASFKASVGPVETDMSGEAARKILQENE